MKLFACACVATLAAAAPQAQAQVTQTYQYDANGRLTGVSTSGASGTNTSAYVYDDANNRVSRTQTGTTAYAALLQMPANEWLRPDQALVSPDGQFSLALRSSGRLELWSKEGRELEGRSGAVAAFSLAPNGYARFSIPAIDASQPDRTLALSDKGELILAEAGGEALWRSSEAVDLEAVQ